MRVTPDAVELQDHEQVVASARSERMDWSPPACVSVVAARAAAERTPFTLENHIVPECFVCGPSRAPDDGLRLGAGPVHGSGDPSLYAVPWRPHHRLSTGDQSVAEEFVWSALDCPTGYAVGRSSQLLGEVTGYIYDVPEVGGDYVITARMLSATGRKAVCVGGLYSERGELLATVKTTWIAVDTFSEASE